MSILLFRFLTPVCPTVNTEEYLCTIALTTVVCSENRLAKLYDKKLSRVILLKRPLPIPY